MDTLFRLRNILLLALALLVGGCAPLQAVQPAENPPAAPPAEQPSPAETALNFYRAYVDAANAHGSPLQDAGFAGWQWTAPEYRAQIHEMEQAQSGAGFDPVLQTQMVPPGPVEVKAESILDGQASVTIQFGRGQIDPPFERQVSLALLDGVWKIVPDQVEGGPASPAETALHFYDWYLSYARSGDPIRNPLTDRAYHDTPYLNPGLMRRVDEIVAGGAMFDPFLCAQDLPNRWQELAVFYNDGQPLVALESDFPGHYLTVELARANFNQWQIRSITCSMQPEGAALALATWVLGYAAQPDGARNPWSDGAYKDSRFLTDAFKEEIAAKVNSGLAADPLLLAQALPQSLRVTACSVPDCAHLLLQYGDSSIRRVTAQVVWEEGQQRINAVNAAAMPEIAQPQQPPAGAERWVPFVDEQYGYGLRYPLDWQAQGLKVTDAHSAEEYPVMRSVYIRPQKGAEDYAAVELSVAAGDEDLVRGLFGLTGTGEPLRVNGSSAARYRVDPGIVYTLIPHPTRPDIWLVLVDSISAFPGRETQAAAMEGIIPAMLSTITFGE